MSRRVGVDGRDPRAQGFPCFGQHSPMAEGRGSLSGRNGHGKWTSCSLCRLRLEYVPCHKCSAERCQGQPASPRSLEQPLRGDSGRRSFDAKPLGEAGAGKEVDPQQAGSSPRGGRSGRVARLVSGVRPFTSNTEVIEGEGHFKTVDEHVPEEIFYKSWALLSETQRSTMEHQAHDLIHEINGTYDELFATTSRLDSMEVCCPPDSRLTQTFPGQGRSAIRIGLPVFDLSTNKGSSESLFNEKSEEQLGKSLERKRKTCMARQGWHQSSASPIGLRRRRCMGMAGNNGGWHLPEMRDFLDWMEGRFGL